MEYLKNALEFVSSKLMADIEDFKPYLPEIPAEGSIFKEGYLLKRSRSTGRNWRRRFFVLEHKGGVGTPGILTYGDSFKSTTKARFEIDASTEIIKTAELKSEGYPTALRISHKPGSDQEVLYLVANDLGELNSWERALLCCVKKMAGQPYDFEDVKTRFYEGTLFKASQNADRWMARHVELHGHELRYYHNPGAAEKGKVDLLGSQIKVRKTDASSAPTKYVFQIIGRERKLNLAAQNEDEYLYWLKAIHQNLANADEQEKREKKVSI